MLTRHTFLGAALGTLLEYYDYALFAILLPVLSPIFFPADTHYEALVKGFVVLCIATVARPIGGIIFGIMGDRYGRKPALLFSIMGIGIASLAIGCIPGYAIIGIAAPLLLLFFKTVQVFCFGGEYNGAGVYIVEQTTERPAFWGSLLSAMTLCGSLLASIVGVIITLPFAPSWVWRIAFIAGGIIAIAGLAYRHYLQESPNFRPATVYTYTFKELIKQHPRGLIAGFFIGGMATVPFTTVVIFINPVLMATHRLNGTTVMLLQTGLMALCATTLVVAGYLADRFSPRVVMRASGFLLAVLAVPALLTLESSTLFIIILGEATLLIANEMLLGPSNAYLTQAFAGPFRYRATSLSFTLGMSVLGGVTPLIEHVLYSRTQHFYSIALWLIAVGLATAYAIHANKEKLHCIESLAPLH